MSDLKMVLNKIRMLRFLKMSYMQRNEIYFVSVFITFTLKGSVKNRGMGLMLMNGTYILPHSTTFFPGLVVVSLL